MIHEELESFIKIYNLSCCCIYNNERNKTHNQKKKKKKKKKNRAASRVNTQPFSEYFSVRMRFILFFEIRIYIDSWRVEINNSIIRVVKYEYDEYFKH